MNKHFKKKIIENFDSTVPLSKTNAEDSQKSLDLHVSAIRYTFVLSRSLVWDLKSSPMGQFVSRVRV